MLRAPMIRFGFLKNHSSLGNGRQWGLSEMGAQVEEQSGEMLKPMWDMEGLGERSKMPLGPWGVQSHTGRC